MIVTFSTENTDPEPMNFIVTGGCGFIGSHLVETLVMMGQNVLVIDDMRNGKTIFKDNPHIKYVHQDVCSVHPTIKEGKFNAIFHLANTPRIRLAMEQPLEALRNGIDPTIHVAEWARKFKCPLFYATSSSTIHSDFTSNPYTFAKTVGEDILALYDKHYGLHYHLLYFYNVYGPREADYGEHSTVIRAFKNQILKGEPLRIFGSGRKTRDFTHIHDVVDMLIVLLKAEKKPRNVHLGTGNPYSIRDVAEAFKHPIVHEFDKPGEAHDTLCEEPYAPCDFDVIGYIKHWKEEFDESKTFRRVQQQLEEIDTKFGIDS